MYAPACWLDCQLHSLHLYRILRPRGIVNICSHLSCHRMCTLPEQFFLWEAMWRPASLIHALPHFLHKWRPPVEFLCAALLLLLPTTRVVHHFLSYLNYHLLPEGCCNHHLFSYYGNFHRLQHGLRMAWNNEKILQHLVYWHFVHHYFLAVLMICW